MSRDDRTWIHSALAQFEGPLTRYAYGITGDLESARDVVQDTFLRLCAETSEQVREHLAPWLYKVCRNRALDVRKKERRALALAPEHSAALTSREPLPTDQLEHVEGVNRALALLEHLPERQREVLRLKFQHEMSYREIGEVTGLSVSNVGFLIHRGLRTLRERLRETTVPVKAAKPVRSMGEDR